MDAKQPILDFTAHFRLITGFSTSQGMEDTLLTYITSQTSGI